MITNDILRQRQSMPLELKIRMSLIRIERWYEYWNGDVHVSFSGGKDSTVLLHLVRSMYPSVPAVFIDTGLEYPEIREFVKTIENVIWLKPKMPFKQVLEKYGYPVVSKENAQKIYEIRNTKSDKLREMRLTGGDKKGCWKLPEKWKYLIKANFKISDKCCDVMKKRPFKRYEDKTGSKPFIGVMVGDSRFRFQSYLNNGCNVFESKRPMSRPLSCWNEDDIWNYIKKTNIRYSKIYDMGWKRTGCMFCMFGVNRENAPNRFQRMALTHPKLWHHCIKTLGLGGVLDYMKIDYLPELRLF